MEPEGSFPYSQEPATGPYPEPDESSPYHQILFLSVSPTPNNPNGGPPLVFCPRLLIQYIRSYLPYLEAVSSIRNLKTRQAMIRDPLNIRDQM
jgi:hypothetical protein